MANCQNTLCFSEREPGPDIRIGPRLQAELQRRIHELENRYKRTMLEQRELADLRELLKVTPTKEL